MLFSIIIPVYNVADYLRKAVDSVLHQDFSGEYEIILVDDGATDISGKMCDEYAAAHPNIRVTHKTNGGLSSARNAGISIATGEYIVFLDGDDWLSPEALSTFERALSQAKVDVLGFSYREVLDSGEVIKEWKMDYASGEVVDIEKLLLSNYSFIAAWSFVWRRDFFEAHGLRFIEGILHEDEEFITHALSYAKAGIFLNYCGYNYLHRSNSIMHNKNMEHLKKRITDSCIIADEFVKLNVVFQENQSRQKVIQRQLAAVNYRIFLNIISSVYPHEWAKEIYEGMKRKKFIPLHQWREDKQYKFYRFLTAVGCPFILLRGICRLIVASSKLRKRLTGKTPATHGTERSA